MAEPTATDGPQTGVVIVALPAADDPVQDIGPEQKHATLLYFGDIPGGSNANDLLDESARATMQSVLAIAAATYGRFVEQVTEVVPLGDAGAQVWMLQGTELPDLRSDLLDTDSELVGILEAVEQYPSYTPHVTVGYDRPAPDQATQSDGAEAATVSTDELAAAADIESIVFDRLALWWAGDQVEYPLTGTADPGRGSATESNVQHQTRPGGPMPTELHESTRLVEVAGSKTAAATTTGATVRKPIQIITPGWGSSGYYSPAVLERAAKNRVIPAGTHMYLNHASESEYADRPEREVEKIAAVLVEDARWDGTRLLADADLMAPHAELIEAVAPYIGVSISGSATDITIGEAEGRRGPIIEDLAHVSSVDFVTHAGRGGMVLLESARPSRVVALAVEHGVAESTANETRELLAQALREMFPGEKVWVWVRDFDDSTVWYEHETPDDCGTYSLDYSLSDDGVVTFSGSPVEVRPETNYVPVPPGGTTHRTEEASPMAEETPAAPAAPETPAGDAAPAAAPTEEPAAGAPPAAESTTPDTPEEQNMSDTTPGAGSAPTQEAGTPPAPTSPRQVMEAQLREQGRQIALLRAVEGAKSLVGRVLAEGWIGDVAKARLTSELTSQESLPLTEALELDEAALQDRATKALHEAEVEAAETLSAAGYGQVRGLGQVAESIGFGPARTSESNPYADSTKEALGSAFGLSESAAETAAKGR